MADSIFTDRLELVPMTPETIRAVLGHEAGRAAELLQVANPGTWPWRPALLETRLAQMEKDDTLIPWLLRAIIRREDRELIGHIGFHTGPDPDYLRDLGLSGIEYGYTVFEPYRRQRFGTEAAVGLMRWARETHGISHFVLSIAPDNEPSLRMARGFGFTFRSVYQDPDDGTEHIYAGEFSGA